MFLLYVLLGLIFPLQWSLPWIMQYLWETEMRLKFNVMKCNAFHYYKHKSQKTRCIKGVASYFKMISFSLFSPIQFDFWCFPWLTKSTTVWFKAPSNNRIKNETKTNFLFLIGKTYLYNKSKCSRKKHILLIKLTHFSNRTSVTFKRKLECC